MLDTILCTKFLAALHSEAVGMCITHSPVDCGGYVSLAAITPAVLVVVVEEVAGLVVGGEVLGTVVGRGDGVVIRG